jgi:hypothetical protein
VRGRNITVDANDGVVTLRGTVENEQAKQQALALAKNVEGVSSVNDELRIETAAATPAATPDSGRLATKRSGRPAVTLKRSRRGSRRRSRHSIS